MIPTLGRIVLFQSEDSGPCPAVVVSVHSHTCVSLRLMAHQDSLHGQLKTSVLYADPPRAETEHPPANTWRWPPRVPGPPPSPPRGPHPNVA